MGWANCGVDSLGRPIGYAFEAICDHPDCTEEINRGLSYACGGMHGAGNWYCENYYCDDHMGWPDLEDDEYDKHFPEGIGDGLCQECRASAEKEIVSWRS